MIFILVLIVPINLVGGKYLRHCEWRVFFCGQTTSKTWLSQYPWLYLWEGRGRTSIHLVGIISSTSPFNEGLSLKISSQFHKWMEVEISFNDKCLKLYLKRKVARNWGNIEAFKQIALEGQDLPSVIVDGRAFTTRNNIVYELICEGFRLTSLFVPYQLNLQAQSNLACRTKSKIIIGDFHETKFGMGLHKKSSSSLAIA